MNSYTTPAYWINSTIYVPVKLVCGKFNLTYSNIPAAAPILRICNSSASLSDSSFVSSSTNTIRSMLDAYNGQSSGSSGSSRPSGSDSDAIPTPIDPTTGQPTDLSLIHILRCPVYPKRPNRAHTVRRRGGRASSRTRGVKRNR